MRIKTFLITFVIVTAALASLGATAWALGAPPERDLPTATVSVDFGQAWIQKNGAGEWLPVAAETPVAAGDRVKTGEKSAARVEFFDDAVARLDESSEVVIHNLALDEDNEARSRVGIEVVAGRVWSRIMKLLDQEASYSARMSNLVATVRGTAFVMDATDPTAYLVRVTENDVAVSALGVEGVESVGAGSEAWIGRAATSTAALRPQKRRIAERWLKSNWVAGNQKLDEEFTRRVRGKWHERLSRSAGLLPSSPFYGLKNIGERLRLALTSDGATRRDLALRYADRRFAEIVALSATGRRPSAERLVTDLHRRYLRLLHEVEQRELTPESAERLCRRLRNRFIEQDAKIWLADQSAVREILERRPENAPDVKILPRELLRQVCAAASESSPSLPPLVPWESVTTTTPLTASSTPIASPPAPLPAINAPTVNTNTNTPVPAPAPTPATSPRTLQKITLIGQRTILYLPDSEQLRAQASYSDGSTADLTDTATWQTSDAQVLTVKGGMVLTTGLGLATVSATAGGQTGTMGIRVVPLPTAAVTLSKLTVACSPSSINRYSSASCTATAWYSDGSTKNVTTAATFTTDPKLATMDGSLFVSMGVPGTANVNAAYTDGATVNGTTTVTIL